MPVTARDEAGGVRVLTLDRPPANAIDESLLTALHREVEEAARDDRVRAVVLAGQGAFFCGGFDLRAPPRDADGVRAMVESYRAAHRALLALPKPTVALVQGHAIAGGLVLALACDVRVMAAGTYRIGLNETAIGASFPAAALEIVRLRLASPVTFELVLEARLYDAADAVRLGLTDSVVPAETALDTALAKAAQLGSFPRDVYANSKNRLVADALARIDAVKMDEELAISALWATEESNAARAAQRRRI